MRSGIMLAQPFEERKYKKWNTPHAIVQPKLNGERCRAVYDSYGHVTLYSSECNIITSVPHINEQLESIGLKDFELDGELYIHEKPFEQIHSIVSRKVNERYDSETMDYHVFDMVSADTQIVRLRTIEIVVGSVQTENIKTVKRDYITDIQSMMDTLNEYYELGYEGIIVRHPLAPYMRKRGPYMMKFKPKKDDIYKIVGYKEEISIYGQPKGRLGSFICCGDDAEYKVLGEVRSSTKLPPGFFSVGSGFNDKQREEYWDNRQEYIGKWCEVQYQNITSANRVPCFPVFVSVKEDIIGGNI